MGSTRTLKKVEECLIKDLKKTAISFRSLGEKYGVTRQAIFDFSKRKGIKRPKRPKKEHTQYCSICQSLLRIAKTPHSDFIASQTIKERLGLLKSKWLYHIDILRKKRRVSPKFGKLHSKKVEMAYQLYFTKRLPIRAIGRLVGLNNFNSTIRQHKLYGWNVPAALFRYGGKARKKGKTETK
jgi:hypothetical protein